MKPFSFLAVCLLALLLFAPLASAQCPVGVVGAAPLVHTGTGLVVVNPLVHTGLVGFNPFFNVGFNPFATAVIAGRRTAFVGGVPVVAGVRKVKVVNRVGRVKVKVR